MQKDKSKQFPLLVAAQSLSTLGSGITHFSMVVWLFQATGSPAKSALLSFLALGPRIYLSLFAGVIVDRFSKWRLLFLSTLLQMMLLAAVFPFIHRPESLKTALPFYVLFSACLDGLQSMVFPSLLKALTPKDKVLAQSAIQNLLQSFPQWIAPFAGMFFLEKLSLRYVLYLDFMSFIPVLVILWKLRSTVNLATSQPRSLFVQVKKGMQFIFSKSELKRSLMFFMVYNFVTGLTLPLVIPFLLLNGGDRHYWIALNNASATLGLVVGAIVLVKFKWNTQRPLFWICFFASMAGLFGRVLVSEAAHSTLALFSGIGIMTAILFWIRNFSISMINALNDLIWYQDTPLDMTGTVFGARRTLAQGTIPLGMLLGPILLGLDFSIKQVFLGAGILEVVVGLVCFVGVKLVGANTTFSSSLASSGPKYTENR